LNFRIITDEQVCFDIPLRYEMVADIVRAVS